MRLRTKISGLGLALIAMGLSVGPSAAHHSFSATFNEATRITIEGVVTDFSFRNPHVLTYISVVGEDGEAVEWVNEGAAATLLRRAGWSSSSLPEGTRVRITGSATWDGSPMIAGEDIFIIDEAGSVVDVLSRNEASAEYEAEPEPTEASEPVGPGAEGGAERPPRGERPEGGPPPGDRPAGERPEGGPPPGDGERPRRQPQEPREVVFFSTPLTLADGTPNISGAWAANHTTTDGRPIPPTLVYNDLGASKQAEFELEDDTQLFCDPPGVVRQAGVTPHPFIIDQQADQIVIQYEEHGSTRYIPYGDTLPEPGVRTHLGDSVAMVEDGAIFVRTVNLLGNLASPEGTFLSHEMTTTEEYRRIDDETHGSVLFYEMTVEDPLYLDSPLKQTKKKTLVDDYEMIETDCQPPLRDRRIVSPYTSLFLTSEGLDGGAFASDADAHCLALAEQKGLGDRGWHAVTGIANLSDMARYNSRGALVSTQASDLTLEGLGGMALANVTETGLEVDAPSAEQFYCAATNFSVESAEIDLAVAKQAVAVETEDAPVTENVVAETSSEEGGSNLFLYLFGGLVVLIGAFVVFRSITKA